MARRMTAGGATLLALLLAVPVSEAQTIQRLPPGVQAVPPAVPGPPPPAGPPQAAPPIREVPQQLPPYYLERRGSNAVKGTLGPNDVAASLRARGFRDIGPVQQRGKTMIIPQATGPAGERVQLVIGPNGEIVGVRVLRSGER
jgi:hypothetical protein